MKPNRGPLRRLARVLFPLVVAACSGIPTHEHARLQKEGGWCEFCEVGWAMGREFTWLCCYDAFVFEGEEACPDHR